MGGVNESCGPTAEPDSTVEDDILEDLDDEMVDAGTAEYLQRSFGKAVKNGDGRGPSDNARETTALCPQLSFIKPTMSTEGAPSSAGRNSADAEDIHEGERENCDKGGCKRATE